MAAMNTKFNNKTSFLNVHACTRHQKGWQTVLDDCFFFSLSLSLSQAETSGLSSFSWFKKSVGVMMLVEPGEEEESRMTRMS